MELTPLQIDSITEIINIGVGRAGNILNKMFGARILLNVPNVKLLKSDDLIKEINLGSHGDISSVNLIFKGVFSGFSKLIFPTESAAKLVAAFTEEETSEDDFDEISSSALAEIGSIVLNSLLGSVGNTLNIRISYSSPTYLEDNIEQLLNLKKVNIEPISLLAKAEFTIENLNITGDFILLFEVGSMRRFVSLIDTYIGDFEDGEL